MSTTSSTRQQDRGLANERTALAWQRTALSIVAAAAIMGRLRWQSGGVAAVLLLGTALILSAWVIFESYARYTHDAGSRRRRRSRGGRGPLFLALATAFIGIAEIWSSRS